MCVLPAKPKKVTAKLVAKLTFHGKLILHRAPFIRLQIIYQRFFSFVKRFDKLQPHSHKDIFIHSVHFCWRLILRFSPELLRSFRKSFIIFSATIIHFQYACCCYKNDTKFALIYDRSDKREKYYVFHFYSFARSMKQMHFWH